MNVSKAASSGPGTTNSVWAQCRGPVWLSYPPSRVWNMCSPMEQTAIPEVDGLSTFELAEGLVELRRRINADEARWLMLVAEFDRREVWRADGHVSMVDWLVVRCGLGRSTAKERVRVAHALGRRPLVRSRFADGSVSYSKVRAITRITDADDDLDERLLALADAGTAADLDRVVARVAGAPRSGRPARRRAPAVGAARGPTPPGLRRPRHVGGRGTCRGHRPVARHPRLVRQAGAGSCGQGSRGSPGRGGGTPACGRASRGSQHVVAATARRAPRLGRGRPRRRGRQRGRSTSNAPS